MWVSFFAMNLSDISNMNVSDVDTEDDVIQWILENNSKEPFDRVQTFLRKVQTEIENCLRSFLELSETKMILKQIDPKTVEFVWCRMEQSYPLFFRYYYLYLRVRDQEKALKMIEKYEKMNKWTMKGEKTTCTIIVLFLFHLFVHQTTSNKCFIEILSEHEVAFAFSFFLSVVKFL